jgi:pentatricopeptide repeat protein
MKEIAAMVDTRGVIILSILLVALCYVNSLPNDFVFDDGPIVSSNPAIRAITPIRFLTSPYWTQQQYLGIYRPFTVFSLSVDYAIWKRWAPGFRFTNLAVHAINGVLLFSLCVSLVGPGLVPLVAMIVYLIHPVHTEAVTSIVGRSELFAACFILSAWLLFRKGRTGWAAIAFALALLSKENAIVLPAILVLDRWLSPRSGGDTVAQGAASRLGLDFGPIALVACAYLVLRFYVLGAMGIPVSAQYMAGHLSYLDRILTAGRVFLRYLMLIFYPLNLAGDYDFNAIPIARIRDWDAWLGILLTFGVIAVAWWYRNRNRVVTVGLLFAAIAFAPSSNWITPISVLMAERFLYLPLAGLSLVAAITYCELKDLRLRWLIGAGGLLTAIILCNSHDYIRRDDFTFFKNMVRVEPNSAKARLGYGFALIQKGRNDEAVDELEAGLRIIPDYPELLASLALAKTTSTSCAQAWPLLERALEIDPANADTHRRMGDCYFKEGRVREAESMYKQAVESIPNPDAMLYFMWGQSLEGIGESTSANAAYERAALIDPDNPFIRQKLRQQ